MNPAHVLPPPSFWGKKQQKRGRILCWMSGLSRSWARTRSSAAVGRRPLVTSGKQSGLPACPPSLTPAGGGLLAPAVLTTHPQQC